MDGVSVAHSLAPVMTAKITENTIAFRNSVRRWKWAAQSWCKWFKELAAHLMVPMWRRGFQCAIKLFLGNRLCVDRFIHREDRRAGRTGAGLGYLGALRHTDVKLKGTLFANVAVHINAQRWKKFARGEPNRWTDGRRGPRRGCLTTLPGIYLEAWTSVDLCTSRLPAFDSRPTRSPRRS